MYMQRFQYLKLWWTRSDECYQFRDITFSVPFWCPSSVGYQPQEKPDICNNAKAQFLLLDFHKCKCIWRQDKSGTFQKQNGQRGPHSGENGLFCFINAKC